MFFSYGGSGCALELKLNGEAFGNELIARRSVFFRSHDVIECSVNAIVQPAHCDYCTGHSRHSLDVARRKFVQKVLRWEGHQVTQCATSLRSFARKRG